MKQNAQDVAIKFMEALDDREQNYYKIIFNCSKRISWAIRNIGVLRKDMEDARELMKGIKEEESISAATSLSEAAKFLGLKWNIQDANYNRQIKNEEGKDEIQIEKERAQEEDAKRQKELKEQEEKKKIKEEKPKEKEIKKILRKSKTLSSVEMMKEVQQMKEASKLGGKEILKVPQKPKTADKEVQTDEIKGPEKVTTATQTTEELLPTKVEETSKEKPEAKIEAELKSEVTKSSEDSTKKESKSETKVEEGQSDKEIKEEENNGKSETRTKPEEKKDGSKKEEITFKDIIKQKDLLKRKDSVNAEPKPPLNRDKIPDLSTLKQRANAQKAKPVPKKPPTEDKATQWEDLEPIPPNDAEKTKNEANANSEKKTVTISESPPEIIDIQSTKEEDEKDDEEVEDDEEEEEQEVKAEEISKKIEEEGAVSSAVSSDSGLSESSKESKKKDPFDDCQVEGKLSEYLHVPGFMLCVEAEDGRLASLEWGPQGLHIHCLQFTHVSYDIVIRVRLCF